MIFWVRILLHATGAELTFESSAALHRGLYIIATSPYATVLAQGERVTENASVHG